MTTTTTTIDATASEELTAMILGVVLMSGLTVAAIGGTGFLLWMFGLQ